MKLSEEVRYWAYRLPVAKSTNTEKSDYDERAEAIVAWADGIAELEAERDAAYNRGLERAADRLDLNYPLCAQWIRKEIK